MADSKGWGISLGQQANRLRQWGRYQIGRALGTVAASSGTFKAFIDLWELALFTRAEINALTKIMRDRLYIDDELWSKTLYDEYKHLATAKEASIPEIELSFSPETGTGVIRYKDMEAAAKRARDEQWPP